MKQKTISLLKDVAIIAVVCVIVNLLMPRKTVNLIDNLDYEQKISILESRMDINRDMMENTKLELDSIVNVLDKNKTKIYYVKSQKTSQNNYVSNLSSEQLFRQLSDRYKDSIK
jgi:hypothetical protein